MDLGQESHAGVAAERAAAAAGIVLVTLASAQFLMTLDSSVMNVSIATVANDVGTTVTGIQTAITFYTLVMASLMITGGNLADPGRRGGAADLHVVGDSPSRTRRCRSARPQGEAQDHPLRNRRLKWNWWN